MPSRRPKPFGPNETVTCPICRKVFRAITNRHLQDKHGMAMADFKAEYPKAQIWSAVTREKMEGNQHALGHRHTEAFKKRWRKAVSKPRPYMSEVLREVWKRRRNESKFKVKVVGSVSKAFKK